MAENPLIVYGRLLEGFHLSGYAFERAYSELEFMLQDGRWIEAGFDDVNKFVASIDLSKFKHSVEQRKKFATLLGNAEASQRATAKMLGVGVATVNRDLAPVPNGTESDADGDEASRPAAAGVPHGTPPEWWQGDADPAKLVQRQWSNEQRDDRREAKLAEINAKNTPLGAVIRYPIIYADPPWRYENPPIGASSRSIENHYPTMTLEAICALPVTETAAEATPLTWTSDEPELPF